MLRKKNIITCLILAFALFSACTAENTNICFFFIGGDLEADSYAASKDILEILRVDIPEDVQVFLLTGGSPNWGINTVPDKTTGFFRKSGESLLTLDIWDDASVSSSDTLIRFIHECAAENTPDRWIFIFWGHGADGTKGIGYDLLHENDTLTLHEMHEAFSETGIHPDIVGFDACAMATLESCWILCVDCDYLVASTEPELLTGWPHQRWLQKAHNSTRDLANAMVESCNADNLRRNKSASMQMICMSDFKIRGADLLTDYIEQYPYTGERAAINSFVDVVGGAIILGKYGLDDIEEALELDGIGETYYRWLATR